MNPIANCCLYYCSGVMLIGIIFFGILMIMHATGSAYLKPENGKNSDQIAPLGIAMAVNADSNLTV
jgi:hypothetical protein